MIIISPHYIVVAVALIGIAAESAWAQEAMSGGPAVLAASPVTGGVPAYAQAPGWRGYDDYWQPPPWPEPPPPPPPPFHDRFDPYYPPAPQYRSAPRAPAENPLSAELKQTQQQLTEKGTELDDVNKQLGTLQTEQQVTRQALKEARAQLAAKITELDSASEQLTGLQAEQQAMREVMQQAQAETAKASEQLSVVVEEMDILYEVLSKLKARLDKQNTSLQGAVEAGAEENGPGGSAVQGDAKPVPSPGAPPVQPGDAGDAQTGKDVQEQAVPEDGEQI